VARTPTRRDFLRAAAVAPGALALACGGGRAGGDPDGGAGPDGGGDAALPDAGPADALAIDARPPLPPEWTPESDQFPLGIAAGDARDGGAVVWCQYTGSAPLLCTVWRMNGDAYGPELGSFPVTPADGGFAHVELAGLVAGARYRYTFFELDGEERVARSLIGRFRAPLADDALEPLTFGAVSCLNRSHPFDPLARAAERLDLDLFLFLGDNAYCDNCTTLDDYRGEYTAHFGKPEHVAVRASTGMLATWDDHEVANNWNPETIDADQLAAATQAFFEHLPVRRLADTPDRIWRSARWGGTAEVFVLDCRGERRPSTKQDADATYLSRAQMDWLEAGLAASTAVFKIIMNSVPITDMPPVWDVSTDRWEGYPAARREILEFIDDQAISGVVWVGGDFHLGFVAKVGVGSDPGAGQLEIAAGPGAQTANPLWVGLQPPQFDFATGTNNYATLHLDPSAGTVRVQVLDGDGHGLHDGTYAVV